MDWISDLGNSIPILSGAGQNPEVLRLLIIAVLVLGGIGIFFAVRLVSAVMRFKPQKKVKPRPPIRIRITLEEFVRLRRGLKAGLQQELEEAEVSERERISARLAELSTQSARPALAFEDMQHSIEELEKLLESFDETLSPDEIARARTALEQVDFSVADQLLARISVLPDQEAERSARASIGRGKISELEFRWHDAAEHFARAARLLPTHDTLLKASTFLWLNGRAQEAIWFEEDLVAFVRRNFGNSDPRTAAVLDNHAGSQYAVGNFARAEEIMIEVLRLGRDIIGDRHPDYATYLNTLALVVEAQGRHREAEEYYRQALEIDRLTIGEAHTDFAVRLGDLATVIEAQGRFDEAEALFRKVLETDRATIGEADPEFAVHLNNLAGVIEAQGRYAEAEQTYSLAVAIIEKALGPEHSNTRAVRRNLESLRQKVPAAGNRKRVLATY